MPDATAGLFASDVDATATSLSLLYDSSPGAYSQLLLGGTDVGQDGGQDNLNYFFAEAGMFAKYEAVQEDVTYLFQVDWAGSPIPDVGPSVPGASIGDDPMLIATVPVPEPSSLILTALGAVGLLFARRRLSSR